MKTEISFAIGQKFYFIDDYALHRILERTVNVIRVHADGVDIYDKAERGYHEENCFHSLEDAKTSIRKWEHDRYEERLKRLDAFEIPEDDK